MIVVVAYFFEVVVLAADAEALLAVDRATAGWCAQTEKYVLKLVHPGVGEKQRLVADGNNGRAGDKLVVFAFEKVDEAGSYLLCGQCHIWSAKLGCRIVFFDNDAFVQTARYLFEGPDEPENQHDDDNNDDVIEHQITNNNGLSNPGRLWSGPVGLHRCVLVSLVLISRVISWRCLSRRCCRCK
jgi:hypothetical protein